jgi:hypothetical protein
LQRDNKDNVVVNLSVFHCYVAMTTFFSTIETPVDLFVWLYCYNYFELNHT